MKRRRPAGPRRPVFDSSDALLDATPVEALDLHGHSATEAVTLAKGFVSTWQRRAPGAVVHIITGQGRRSVAGAVLKPAIARLLRTELFSLVADWSPDGDDGGYLVKLR